MAKIGIRLANGEFYSVLDDSNPAKKRVTLTTVQDDQQNVQIDILRRADDAEKSEYVGTLLLEDLSAEPGHPVELELVVGVDQNGTISARLGDTQGSQYQSFSIEADQIEQQGPFGLPDFDTEFEADIDSIEDVGDEDLGDLQLDDDFPDLGDEVDAGVEESLADRGKHADYSDEQDQPADEEEEVTVPPRPFQPLLLVAIVLVTLSVLSLGAYLIFKLLQSDALPELTRRAATILPFVLVPRSHSKSRL